MATGKDKFELVIEVNSQQGNASIKGVNKSLSDLERQAVQSTSRASAGMDRMTDSVMKGALGVLALYAGVTRAFGALKQFTLGALATADEMGKSAQKIGMSVEQYAEYRHVADLAGVSAEKLATGVGVLSKNMMEAARSNNTYRKAFNELGVDFRTASGALRSADDVLVDLANKFKVMPDGAAKTAYAMSLIGRSGREMIPLLNEGGDAIKRTREEAHELGRVINEETIRAAEIFNDNISRLKGAVEGLAFRLAEDLVPSLVSVTDKMVAWARDGGVDKVVKQMRDLAEWVKNLGMWIVSYAVVTGIMKMVAAIRAMQIATVGLNAALLANPWGLAAIGVATFGAAVWREYDKIKDFRKELEGANKQAMIMAQFKSGKTVDEISAGGFTEAQIGFMIGGPQKIGALPEHDRFSVKGTWVDTNIAPPDEAAIAEAKRRLEEIERSKQYISADAVRAGGIMREAKGRVDALTTLPGFSGISPEAAQIARESQSIANASDDAFVREWIQRRESAALSVQEQNENMIAAQMRRDGNYQGALEIELAQLERLKARYEGNAEAIAALEEQKKLKIIDANREIADNAKSEFERSAQSIEGFFNRVFMNAKSLADVWRQLWGQLANYAVQQISRMVAASIGGYRQAAAPAMGGGGIAAIFPAIMGGGGGGGGGAGGYAGIGTPPFVPSTSGGGGFGSLFNSGFLSNLGTNFVNFAMSPLGALAGVGMFAAGAKRGGASGLALSAGGGWLGGAGIGSMIAGPYGAAIGAAVGLGAGLISGIVGLFRKSPEEKLKEKIRSAYGVNIHDKGVLQQILSVAQGFGGNLDMAIRHKDVVELISLYAQTTNQTMRGAPKQMTSATLIQSGGSLSMMPSYTNGTPSMGSLPGAGIDNVRATGATGGTVINITVPGAKEFFEKETVTVIAKNGRAVATANASAATGNFGRTQMAATLLKPGLVTS
jgi:hypothetical protein